MVLPLPDISTDYIADKANRPSKDFYNWLKSLNDAVGSISGTGVSEINVKMPPYNAKGNGTTDDTTSIQAAIDYAESIGGGFVVFPPGNYLCNLVLKHNVQLVAQRYGHHGNVDTNYPILTAVTEGALIDTPVDQTFNLGVIGFCLRGLGAGPPGIGIHLRNVKRTMVRSCFFDGFGDQGLLHEKGWVLNFSDSLMQNCLLNRTRSDFSGALEFVQATDNYIKNVEMTASLFELSSSELCCAANIQGSTHFFTDCVFEISDIGLYVGSQFSKFTSCRADANLKEGFYVDGGLGNMFVNCESLSNSLDGANIYSAFRCTSTARRNMFTGCFGHNLLSNYKYIFDDANADIDTFRRNSYIGCRGDQFIAFASLSATESAYIQPLGYWLQVGGFTTYDVVNVGLLEIGGGAPQTITAFGGGVPGQVLRILATNPNITLQNSAQIVTNTGANKLLNLNMIYTFTCYNATGGFMENGL